MRKIVSNCASFFQLIINFAWVKTTCAHPWNVHIKIKVGLYRALTNLPTDGTGVLSLNNDSDHPHSLQLLLPQLRFLKLAGPPWNILGIFVNNFCCKASLFVKKASYIFISRLSWFLSSWCNLDPVFQEFNLLLVFALSCFAQSHVAWLFWSERICMDVC